MIASRPRPAPRPHEKNWSGARRNDSQWTLRVNAVKRAGHIAMAPCRPNGELGPEEIWTEPIDRILTRLATTRAGLDAAEVQSRLTRYGPNTAATVKHLPLWLQFLARFRSPWSSFCSWRAGCPRRPATSRVSSSS